MVAGTRGIAGVTSVEASPLERRLIVHFDPERTNASIIGLAVDRIVATLPQ